MGFFKKLWDITAELAWTYAGSAVVLMTLSGDTQEMAFIATITALVVHYLHELNQRKND